MAKLTVSSAPASEPISTAEAKEWLRIDTADTSQDTVLGILIQGVRERVEDALNRSLINRTYSLELNAHDMVDGLVRLQRGPVSSITSVTTYDDTSGSEVATVVPTTDYQLVNGHYLVARNDGWEVNRTMRAGTVVYVAGYGANATDVPYAVRIALLELLALRFERRGDEDRDHVVRRELEIMKDLYHYRLST